MGDADTFFLVLLVASLVGCGVSGLLGSHVARVKHRPGAEGFLLGFFLFGLGVLIEALLPNGTHARARSAGLDESGAREFLDRLEPDANPSGDQFLDGIARGLKKVDE